MRKDEEGNCCPETLGEYRDLCAAIGGEDCQAVALLDEKIKDPINKKGRDEKVIVTDHQIRMILFPLIGKKIGDSDD